MRALVASQATRIPGAASLPLVHAADGWDCSVWRLGDELAVRLPRRALAAPLILHEQEVLSEIAGRLAPTGVGVPAPVVHGRPGFGYPWSWSVVPWFHGQSGLGIPRATRTGWARSAGRRAARAACRRSPSVSGQSRARCAARPPDAGRRRQVHLAARAGTRHDAHAASRAVGCRARRAGMVGRAALDPRRPPPREPRRARVRAGRDHRLRRRHRRRPGIRSRRCLAGLRSRGTRRVPDGCGRSLRRRTPGLARTAGRRRSLSCCSTRATTTRHISRSAPRRWQS